MPRAPLTARHRRAGFTLVEFMIALVLFAIVGGALLNVITRQQRFFRIAHEQLSTRAHMRYAGALLPTDLRPIYPTGGDVYAWRDTMLEFRQVLGSGATCQIFPAVAATQRIGLPPLTLARQGVLTSWLAQPQVGDSIMLYDDGPFVGDADNTWRPYGITAVATTTGATACLGTFVPTAADLAGAAYQLTLDGTVPLTVLPGAPVRVFRRARYSFFRQASDGKWYLGYSDCLAGRVPVCSTPPLAVAGPYRPYSSTDPGATGLAFTYRDANGAQLVPGVGATTAIARIDVVTRTQTTPTASYGGRAEQFRDSLKVSVGLRNR